MVMHQTQQNNRRTTRSSATTTTTTTSTNNTFTTTTTDQQQEQQQTQQFDETTTNHDAFDRRQQQKDFDHQILSHAFPFSTHDSTSVSNFITDVKVDPKRKLLLASTYSSGRVYVFDLDTRKFLYSIQVGDRSGCCYYLTIEEPFRHENDLIMMKGLSTTSSTTGTTSTTSSTTTTTTNEDENRHMPSSMTWDQETIQMACTYPSVIVTTDMYSYYTIEKFIMCPTLYEPNVRTATRLSNHRSRMWKCTSSEFNALRGLCVDHSSRRLFVSDRDASKIRVLSSRDGHLLKSFAFNAPTDLAFYEGNLFVCEKSTNGVHIVSSIDGSILRSIAVGCFNYPRGVVVDPNTKHIIVSDSDHHKIKVFNWTGEMLEEFQHVPGSTHSNLLNTPFGLSLDDHAGFLYVADCYNYMIQVFHYNARWYKNEKRFKDLLKSSKQEQFSDLIVIIVP